MRFAGAKTQAVEIARFGVSAARLLKTPGRFKPSALEKMQNGRRGINLFQGIK
ncbi:hypothetical protein HUU40_32700 [candidate division KSB1 bacterium]|nr:hypothetical protein [candidate division KSB1 bacterium]